MSDFMEEGDGIPVESPDYSQTLQRVTNLSTGELLMALMATVGDLSTTVAQTNAQQAITTDHMHAVAEYLAHRHHDGWGSRPEFRGETTRFDDTVDVKAWLRTLELIFDAKGLTIEERFCTYCPC